MGSKAGQILSVLAPIAGTLLLPGVGTALGLGAGGLGIGATGLAALGGGIGGAAGGVLNGGGLRSALKGAALGSAGGYLGGGGTSELIGGTALGNTLGLSAPEGGSVIGNILGSSPASPNTLGSLLSGAETSAGGASRALAPSVTGGTANAAPLTGGESSAPVPSNTLSSSTLPSSGGGASSYSGGIGNGNIDLTSADPSISNGAGIGGTQPTSNFSNMFSTPNAGTYNYDITGNPAGSSSYSAPTELNNSITSAISPGNASTAVSSTGAPGMISGINGLGTALSGVTSYLSNNKAQNALKTAQNNAMSVLQPYLASGGAANNTLSSLLGTNPNSAMTPAQILAASPQYQFQLQQGNQQLDRQDAARGGYFSGGAIKAGQDFAAGLANQTSQQYVQNLAQQAGQGANAANAAGNIYGNIGSATANNYTANNGVFGNTLGMLLGSGYNPYLNAMRPSY